ncbi:MAG: hypothetical protein LBJ12_05310 [Oscillospiraceae bacterium]|jgi:hypothetical protein|nr:hypothetical protein [Oscillospiraceae bacterium]
MKNKRLRIFVVAAILVIGSAVVFFRYRTNLLKLITATCLLTSIAAAVGHVGIDKNFVADDYSLVYENANGAKTTYIFTHPIRYFGGDEQYHIIDNSIIPDENGWTNKANEIQTSFDSDNLSASLGEIQ